jgi:transcriptional regulator with XRE-family HTH domain
VPALIRNALVRLLAERGWTDAELAARAGLDRGHLNQVKNGHVLPTVATALALGRALGVPVAAIFPPSQDCVLARRGTASTGRR